MCKSPALPGFCTLTKPLENRSSDFRVKDLPLRELLAAASGVQADLLAFHFARVAGDEARGGQRRLEGRVVVDQGAGDAVAHGAGLAGFTAAVDVDLDVEGFDVVGQHQR